MSDSANERRLMLEARTVLLGTLTHPDVPKHAAQCARVEVSYQPTEDDVESCGYFLVWVPSYADPWTESRELTELEAEQRWPDAAYFSVDDIYAA